MVAYSHVKLQVRGALVMKCKPSGMAFALFAEPRFAEMALSLGEEQLVRGATLLVNRYEPDELPKPSDAIDAPIQVESQHGETKAWSSEPALEGSKGMSLAPHNDLDPAC